MTSLYKIFMKNIWLKKWYQIVEEKDTYSIYLKYNEKAEQIEKPEKESFSLYDTTI